jgi:hypothetical protein
VSRFTIKAGKHYHGMPPLSTLPWVGAQSMTRTVVFDASCAYDSAAYNSADVNKLFGLSFGFGGVHGNSARFGWRWSMADQCIELLAYVYKEGKRNQDEQLRFPVVAKVELGQSVACSIEYTNEMEFGQAVFEFNAIIQGSHYQKTVNTNEGLPCYGLTHGLYFGGALTAPHAMTVQIDR